jgi:hypothetical protein
VAAVGVPACLFFVVALAARSSGLLPWALALAGAEYAVYLVIQKGTIDASAPVYAAGLLVAAELAYWSLERPVPSHEALVPRRISLVLAACLAAGGVGGVILTMAELSISGGLVLEILGVAAAVGALALVATLAREGP